MPEDCGDEERDPHCSGEQTTQPRATADTKVSVVGFPGHRQAVVGDRRLVFQDGDTFPSCQG